MLRDEVQDSAEIVEKAKAILAENAVIQINEKEDLQIEECNIYQEKLKRTRTRKLQIKVSLEENIVL